MSRVNLVWSEKTNPLIQLEYTIQRQLNGGEWETVNLPIELINDKYHAIDNDVAQFRQDFINNELRYRIISTSLEGEYADVASDPDNSRVIIPSIIPLDDLDEELATDVYTIGLVVDSSDEVITESPDFPTLINSLMFYVDTIPFTMDEYQSLLDTYFTEHTDETFVAPEGFTTARVLSAQNKHPIERQLVVRITVPESLVGKVKLVSRLNPSAIDVGDEGTTILMHIKAAEVIPEEPEEPEEPSEEPETP